MIKGAKPNKSKIDLLEALRGFAAVYVFLGHFALNRLNIHRGVGGLAFQFGQEAVMLFFLISGFVIYLSVARQGMTFSGYLKRRAVRIFPIYLLALGCSYFLTAHDGVPLWSNVLMLQDFKGGKPGVWFSTYGSNFALWSLSYEWWFYMMFFPVHRLLPERWQSRVVYVTSAAATAVFAFWPNQLSLFLIYFSIWWVGVELARTHLSGEPLTLRNQRTNLAALLGLGSFFGCWTLLDRRLGLPLSFGIHPVLEFRHFLAAALIVVVACLLTRRGRKNLQSALRPFLVAAPISYALYALHMPLVVNATYLGDRFESGVAITIYVLVLIAVAVVAEGPVQRYITRATGPRASRIPSEVPAPSS